MRPVPALILTLCLAAACSGDATAPEDRNDHVIRVTGQVTDLDGTPLPQAFVELYRTECLNCTFNEGESIDNIYGSSTCDDEGRFAIAATVDCRTGGAGPKIRARAGGFLTRVQFTACTAAEQTFEFALPKEAP